MIVLSARVQLILPNISIPRVISIDPMSTDSTIFWFILKLNTPHIAVLARLMKPIFFSTSMIRKLRTM